MQEQDGQRVGVVLNDGGVFRLVRVFDEGAVDDDERLMRVVIEIDVRALLVVEDRLHELGQHAELVAQPCALFKRRGDDAHPASRLG